MNWIPNEKEIEAILSLDASKRYNHCIKKLADLEEIWSLWQEGGWALACDDTGRQMVPIWPHSKYAALCAEEMWKDYQPKAIPLDVWLDRWISGLERDQRLIAVFPTPKDKGIPVEPSRLEQDLRKELLNYE